MGDVNFDKIIQKARTGDRNAFRDMTLYLSRQHHAEEAEAGAEPSQSTLKSEVDAGADLLKTARSQVIAPYGTDLEFSEEDIKAKGYGSSLEPSCMLHGAKEALRRPQSPEKPNRTSGDIISWRNDYGKSKGEEKDDDLQNILNRLQRSSLDDPDPEEIEAGMSAKGGDSMAESLTWTNNSFKSSEKPATRPYGATRAPFAIDEEPIRSAKF